MAGRVKPVRGGQYYSAGGGPFSRSRNCSQVRDVNVRSKGMTRAPPLGGHGGGCRSKYSLKISGPRSCSSALVPKMMRVHP